MIGKGIGNYLIPTIIRFVWRIVRQIQISTNFKIKHNPQFHLFPILLRFQQQINGRFFDGFVFRDKGFNGRDVGVDGCQRTNDFILLCHIGKSQHKIPHNISCKTRDTTSPHKPGNVLMLRGKAVIQKFTYDILIWQQDKTVVSRPKWLVAITYLSCRTCGNHKSCICRSVALVVMTKGDETVLINQVTTLRQLTSDNSNSTA